MEWFHETIVCRYGVPVVVRSDNGKEFQGDFKLYLQSMGVHHSQVLSYNPRANGLAERYVGAIKAGLRRLKGALPDEEWYTFLPEVLAGLRFLPTKLGLSPYLMVFKQEPRWHDL